MLKAFLPTVVFFAVLLGLFPILDQLGLLPFSIQTELLSLLNLIGWTLFVVLTVVAVKLAATFAKLAETIGVQVSLLHPQQALASMLDIIARKNKCLAVNIAEQRISTREELSKTLERLATLAYKLLNAESVELALFDKDTGLYHSSFVLGKPFRSSAQAILSGAMDNNEVVSPDVLVHPITFAGGVKGTFRVALEKGKVPAEVDQEIMRLLSIQTTIAIINSEYSEELMRMRVASEESTKAKTGFLANLSHELRGPLGLMINAVELVLDGLCGDVTEDQKETLAMVRQNARHLMDLINDVLDYAKLESGKIIVQKSDLSVNDLLLDMIKVIRPQAEEKAHSVTFSESTEELVISCDRRHSRQIMINLLTNAVKYTKDRGVLEVWAERIPGNYIRINVRDNGVGIEPSQHSKVFTPFERVDNSYSMKQVGAGLGMSLTKRLVEVNGGTIGFESQPGVGSHFWVAFPAVEAHQSVFDTGTTNSKTVNGSGKTLLLLANDNDERKMMVRYLEYTGFKVVTVDSMDDVLEQLISHRADLMIIENDAVDTFGGDFVHRLRTRTRNPTLPIVLISSRGFVFDIEEYLRAGVDRCLTRPVEFSELALTVFQLIQDNQSVMSQAKRTGASHAHTSVPKENGPLH